MREKIYDILVNRHEGIRVRYHISHDGKTGAAKVASWFYLLWLNLRYYVLFNRSLNRDPGQEIQMKKFSLERSESEISCKEVGSVEDWIKKAEPYGIVSFDIFDTLVFRPFDEPVDVFYFIQERLQIPDFKRIRMEMEAEARKDKKKNKGTAEVSLSDIWEKLEKEVGVSKEKGMETEQELELKFCYANPFMMQVFRELKNRKKKIIAVSDMYLSSAFLRRLLEKCGYDGIETVFVSCEEGFGKAKGKLFQKVIAKYGSGMIHIGDNYISDFKGAKEAGLASLHYPAVNRNLRYFRCYDMSMITGGAYRGIVTNLLYSGAEKFSMEKEYGFVFGGLFAAGYCRFIHEYCKENGIEKLLFLSRDGDLLQQVYKKLYPQEADKTVYAHWSRAVATRLMAKYDRYDYFRRFLRHKVNQEYSIKEILKAMQLEELLNTESFRKLAKDAKAPVTETTLLTDDNVKTVTEWLQENYAYIISRYQAENKAAGDYYTEMLKDCRKAAAVDIGWAGSGALALSFLAENEWGIGCSITGIIAGTNSAKNAEPDATEIFRQEGKLVSFLFSQSENRDVWFAHDPSRLHNIYWELLLSSPRGSCTGFEYENGKPKPKEGKPERNAAGIREIQAGILRFTDEYLKHFGDIPYMLRISGRDAAAPLHVMEFFNAGYLKNISDRFKLNINVE